MKKQGKLNPLFLQHVSRAAELFSQYIHTFSQQLTALLLHRVSVQSLKPPHGLSGGPVTYLFLDMGNSALRLYFIGAENSPVCWLLHFISWVLCWKTSKITGTLEKRKLLITARQLLWKKICLHSTLHCGGKESLSATLKQMTMYEKPTFYF